MSIIVIFIVIIIIISLFQFGLKKYYEVKKHYDLLTSMPSKKEKIIAKSNKVTKYK